MANIHWEVSFAAHYHGDNIVPLHRASGKPDHYFELFQGEVISEETLQGALKTAFLLYNDNVPNVTVSEWERTGLLESKCVAKSLFEEIINHPDFNNGWERLHRNQQGAVE